VILTSLDTAIVNRLKKIRINNTEAVVYGPGDARNFGETVITCFAVSRISPLCVDMKMYNHFLDVFGRTGEETEFTVPNIGVYQKYIQEYGDTIAGYETWIRRKCPIPASIDYQVDVLATNLTHRDYMEIGMAEALPVFYRLTVEGQSILLLRDGDPVVMDDLDAPLFRGVHRYTATNIWLQRTGLAEYAPISELTTVIEAEE